MNQCQMLRKLGNHFDHAAFRWEMKDILNRVVEAEKVAQRN